MSRSSETTNVRTLADRIEADIRDRGLRSGDQYYNSMETARHFSVSTRAANCALQLLAHRKIIKRRQRLGTFVALTEQHHLPEAPVNLVHLLMHETFFKKEGLLTDGVLVGIQGVMPRVNIQLNFLSVPDEGAYVEELIDSVLKSNQRAGLVVVRASLETQRAIGRSGLPSVIHGTICSSVDNVSSLDRDNRQSGRLLIEHLVKHECKNVLLMLRNSPGPGHHVLLDSLFEAVREFGIDPFRIVYRFMPPDEIAVQREIASLSQRLFTDKCGIICDSRPIAEGACKAVNKLNLPEDLRPQIIAAAIYMQPGTPRPTYPYIYPEISPQQIGERIGNLLLQQASGNHAPVHATYPVKIVLPGEL